MPPMRGNWPALVCLAVVGCNTPNPDARIQTAGDLAAQQLGQRPAWTLPWDDTLPAWTADGLLQPDEAVALALRNNRMLRADLEMIGQADADLVQAGLMQNPVINFMAMFPDGGGRAMLRGTGVPLQPLQDLWLIPARRKVATAALQEAVLRVAGRAVETAAAAKAAYARVQYAQRALELLQESIELAEQSTRIVQTRQSTGQVTQVAVNVASIRAQRLRSERVAMEAEHRAAQRELLLVLGLPGAPDRWAVAPINEMTDALPLAQDEQELVSLGADQRLDLKAAGWSLQSAEQRIGLRRLEGLPELALGFSFERSPAPRPARGPTVPARVGNAVGQAVANRVFGAEPGHAIPQISPWTVRANEFTWTLGPMIDMTVPIFDQNQAQVAKAIHEYNQKLAEYQAREQEITRDIRTALLQQQQAAAQAAFYRTSIMPEVERNLGLAQQSFVAGQDDLTVYLAAQEDLIMTRRRILEFVRDYLVSRVELERAVGGRLEIPAPTSQPAPASTPAAPAETRPAE